MRRIQSYVRTFRRSSSTFSQISFTSRGHSIDRQKIFEYTNGRFLINEQGPRQKRFLKFDIDELCSVASAVGSKSPVKSVEKMEGGFSKALLMTKLDGSEVVAKLPFRLAGPPKLTTAAEVAVLEYVHHHTKVPVPKVLAWSSDPKNSVGAEYIIMEKAAGVQLVEKWHEMKDLDHFSFIRKLCALEAELASIKFPSSGSLYLRESMSQGEAHTLLSSDIDPEERFCIGPFCERGWDHPNIDSTLNRPLSNLAGYGQNLVRREIQKLQSLESPTFKSGQPPKGGSVSEQAAVLQLAALSMREMGAETMPGLYSQPTLWHTDLHFGNIYVSPEDPTNITSLIDWQGIVVAPLLCQVRFPEFLELSDDYEIAGPVPRLPDGFDQMDPDDQYLAKYEHKQACMAKTYEAACGLKDKRIYRTLRLPAFFKELFIRASESSEEGIVPLRACLIEIAKNWKDAGFSTPCPLTFSHECIETHELEFQKYSNFHAVQKLARQLLGTDSEGWLSPNEDFARKSQQNKDLLQLVMDTNDQCSMAGDEIKHIWPF